MLLLTLRFGLLPAHVQQADSLQQRMSADQFKAAGPDKLSTQEPANLDHWLVTPDNAVTDLEMWINPSLLGA